MKTDPENKVKKILEMYSKYEFPDEITDEIKQWLVSERHAEEKERVLWKIWKDVTPSHTANKKEIFEDIKVELGLENNKRPFFSLTWVRVVAAVVIMLIISTVSVVDYFGKQEKEILSLLTIITTSEEERKHTELFENTQMWLNGDTEVSYINPSQIALNGEAFFDVQKMKYTNFSVKGHSLEATVTGTRFNFRSYDSEDISVISLYEGSLKVATPDTIVVLEAGYELEYNSSTFIMTIRNLSRLQPDWMRDIINFENALLTEIFSSIENIYGVKIESGSLNITDDRIELKFEEGISLDDVMFFLSQITGTFEYNIQGKIVYVKDMN